VSHHVSAKTWCDTMSEPRHGVTLSRSRSCLGSQSSCRLCLGL